MTIAIDFKILDTKKNFNKSLSTFAYDFVITVSKAFITFMVNYFATCTITASLISNEISWKHPRQACILPYRYYTRLNIAISVWLLTMGIGDAFFWKLSTSRHLCADVNNEIGRILKVTWAKCRITAILFNVKWKKIFFWDL